MPETIAKGLAQTVLGPVSPDELGPTSSHEHLMLDFTLVFKPAAERHRAYDPFRSYDNLVTIDEEVAIEEAALFKRAGGMTMVDTTSRGLSPNPPREGVWLAS